MKLHEAVPILKQACGVKFGELFKGHPEDLKTNKGHVGQLLQTHVGLTLTNALTDFEDGELKTNKANLDSSPKETLAISQIKSHIDSLIVAPSIPFLDSWIHQKIRNFVYLPVVKESKNASDWYFTKLVHVRVDTGTKVFKMLEEDFESIALQLIEAVNNPLDGLIHTTNGVNGYLQVRSKDSKPYHPIFSQHYGRNISNKNHAFYFTRAFLIDALAGEFEE